MHTCFTRHESSLSRPACRRKNKTQLREESLGPRDFQKDVAIRKYGAICFASTLSLLESRVKPEDLHEKRGSIRAASIKMQKMKFHCVKPALSRALIFSSFFRSFNSSKFDTNERYRYLFAHIDTARVMMTQCRSTSRQRLRTVI